MSLPKISNPPRYRRSATVAALAVSMVCGFEGLRTAAYTDPVGIPTICFGETKGVRLGDTATADQCKAMLDNRLADFSVAIDRCLPADLPAPAYAAFLSASYNIGTTAFCSSSMARRARAGDLAGACDALTMWDKATVGGVAVRLPGLTARRAEERAMCLTGVDERRHDRRLGQPAGG